MSYTTAHMYFEDVHVGQEWESYGRTVTETDIVNFAGLSGDFNPIHMDHEFAKKTIFRQPIAHGLLILSMGSGLGLVFPPMRTIAFLGMKDWTFLEPVYIGDTIRVKSKLLEKEERSRGRRAALTWQRRIVKQADKVVQEGVVMTLVEGRKLRDRNQESGARSQESEKTNRDS